MPTVKVSSKFQVVIPKEIREEVGVKPGQQYEVMAEEDQIVFVPKENTDIKKLRGFLKGKMTAENIRDEEDRF